MHSIDETVHGLEERVYLSHEGWKHADDWRHGCRPWPPPREAEELSRSSSSRWSKLRRSSLYRVHQKLASKR